MTYRTDQETAWAGDFGDKYITRNNNPDLIASNIAFFARALRSTSGVKSILEFGANIGLNLKAINQLFPYARLSGVEINHNAAESLRGWGGADVVECSILDYPDGVKHDMVLSKGLLIHIAPGQIKSAYDRIYQASRKYILLAEYYNPAPVEIEYQGHRDRLCKRDFAGEMLEIYPDLELVDYGFVYHCDPNFKQDDMTWFLMKKN